MQILPCGHVAYEGTSRLCPHLMADREVMKLAVKGFSDAMKCSRCREGRKFSKYEIDREADGASPSRP